MYKHLQHDHDNIDTLIQYFYRYASETLKDFDKRKVGLVQQKFIAEPLSQEGIGFLESLKTFNTKYESFLSGSMGARYFGFVTGGATPASLLGDWLTALYDQNVANLAESSSGDITLETLTQLKELFELDETFEGIFVSGATMSNFVGLATAREWIGRHYNIDIAREGLHSLKEPIHIYSATPHSSIYKSLSMLGIGQNALTLVKTEAESESINIHDLEEKLKNQNGLPCIVVANAGTVNTVGFDNLSTIAELKKHYTFWLHVDAAFGGFAKCSPKHKHLVEGLEHADSITIDAHKWLNVPYDAAMHFTKHLPLQFEVFKNTAPYLQPNYSNANFVHLTPENSQRLRALPTWFSLLSYGKEGYREIVERNCTLAEEIAEKIKTSEQFVLLSEVILNGVLFTLNHQYLTNDLIHHFIQKIKEDGRIFITPTLYRNAPALRISISNWKTTSTDMEIAWQALVDIYQSIESDSIIPANS